MEGAISKQEQSCQLLHPTQVVVTSQGTGIFSTLKYGTCIIETLLLDKQYCDKIQKVEVLYNRTLHHLHVMHDYEQQEKILKEFQDKSADQAIYLEKLLCQGENKFYQVSLEHSEICPARAFMKTESKHEIKQNIKVAVCVVVFDCQDRMLITRRSPKLRHFPSCWVIPGGHLDPNESLELAGLRELSEEVGIYISLEYDQNGKQCCFYNGKNIGLLDPFYAFESSTPLKEDGSPPANIFVLFFKLKIGHLKADEIPLKLQRSETDAAVWMNSEHLKKVIEMKGKDEIIEGYIPKQLNEGESDDALISNTIKSDFKIEQFYSPYPNDYKEGFGKALLRLSEHYLSTLTV